MLIMNTENLSKVNVQSLIQIAMQKHKLNQLDEAELIYKKILQLQPNNVKSLYSLGILLQQKGKLQEATQVLNIASEIQSDSVEIWFILGNLLQHQGVLLEAEAAYKKAITLQPNNISIYNNLGYTLQQQGKLDEAIATYQKALHLQPDCIEADINLGSALHAQGKLSPEKQAYYGDLNYKLGLTREQACDLKTAEACYRQALELVPNQGKWYFNLGKVYQQQKNFQQAIVAYREGLKLLNPRYAEALAANNNVATTEEATVTPPIPQAKVTVGAYEFPAIPPVVDKDQPRPFWSVVMPVYNRTEYLLEALASVLVQWPGPEEMEILVIDNASTVPLLHELINSLGRGVISYYRNPENLGVIGNNNAAIALSRGQWVHVLHDDDCVLPGFYAHLQKSLENCPDSVGVACTGFEYFNEKGETIQTGEIVSIYGEKRGIMLEWLSHIGVCGLITMPAIVVRRTTHERFGGYYPGLPEIADWEIFKRYASFCDWWYEPGIFARYREHTQRLSYDNMLSGKLCRAIRCAIEVSDSYFPEQIRAELTAKSRRFNFNYCLKRAAITLEAGNSTGALFILHEAIKLDSSPQALEKLFTWLTQEKIASLGEEIVARLFTCNPSQEKQHYYAQLNYQLGLRLKKAGNLQIAQTCYQKAIELNPNQGEAYMGLGEIYQIQRNLKEAASAYKQGLKLINPHYAAAQEAYEKAQIPQQVQITPSIPPTEVIVGNYTFPAIASIENNDKQPFWSVVIPIYNRTDYLLQCLASVLSQWNGAENMEIIVVDNASTQPLFELVNEIGGGIVRYYLNPENMGAVRNFNTGIALSRGKWVHVLNDDDYVLPDYYARLKQNLLECPDSVGFAFTKYENVNEQGKIVYSPALDKIQPGFVQNWLQIIGVSNPLNMCAVVIRRDVHERLGLYRPDITFTPDWELYIRIAICYDSWYIPETLACCREHSQNLTQEMLASGKNIGSVLRTLEIIESYLPVKYYAELTAKARSYFFDFFLANIPTLLKSGDVSGAFNLIQNNLKVDCSSQALHKLFIFLAQNEIALLREEIVSRLFDIPLSKKNFQNNTENNQHKVLINA